MPAELTLAASIEVVRFERNTGLTVPEGKLLVHRSLVHCDCARRA